MPTIRLETITPVHIGNGNTMRDGIDYLAQGNKLYILDLQKAAQLLGGGHDAYSIKNGSNRLAMAIENATLRQLLQRYDLSCVSKRILTRHKGIDTANECREQIRDGRGMPYIPGSSIKGAIRTALLASFTDGLPKNAYINDINHIEGNLFGAKPENDIFRFLQVGDAYFADNDCSVYHSVILNERERGPFVYESVGRGNDNKQALVEVINHAVKSTLQLKLARDAYNRSNLPFKNRTLSNLFSCEDYESLFKIIDAHTRKLIQSEIDWWDRQDRRCDDSDNYLGGLEEISDMKIGSNSCILRVGYGSGFRFITGDWTRQLDRFSEVSPSPRWRAQYGDKFEFPKSRRVTDDYDDDNQLFLDTLGFIKLTIE